MEQGVGAVRGKATVRELMSAMAEITRSYIIYARIIFHPAFCIIFPPTFHPVLIKF